VSMQKDFVERNSVSLNCFFEKAHPTVQLTVKFTVDLYVHKLSLLKLCM
jgi:hypothetical protein